MKRRLPLHLSPLVALFIAILFCPAHSPEARAVPLQRRQRSPAPVKRKTVAAPTVAAPREVESQTVRTEEPPAAPAPAQQDVAQEVGEDEVLRIDSNLVSVPATVIDSFGRSINDLKLEDFELRVDGKVKPLGEVTRAETPVRLAILFDNSTSLSKAREFEKLAAVRFFQRVMRPFDQAAIYSVSTTPVLTRPLTGDVRTLVRSIELFPEPEGATALFDAITQAAQYLRPFDGRKVILIVSDGNDTVSENTFDHALKQALAADCQIFVVGTGDIDNPNLLDNLAKRRLAVFAQQTGGAVSIPLTVDDLDAAFERISNDIAQQYVLSYFPTDDPPDGRFRTLALQVTTRSSLRVRARRGYYARAGEAHVRPRRARSTGREAAREKTTDTQNVSFDPLNAPQGNSATAGLDAFISSIFIVSAKNRGRAYDSPPPTQTPATTDENKAGAVEARVLTTAGGTSPVEKSSSDSPVEKTSTSEEARETMAARPQGKPSEQDARDAARNSQQTETRAGAPDNATNTRRAADAKPAVASTQKTAAPSSVSGGVLNGRAISLPKPVFPSAARSVGAKGTVSVEVLIDESGKVVRARAVSGHPLLQQAAVMAARQAKFSPALLSGQPVQVSGLLHYNFIINE